jgi:cytochrome c556
MISSRARAIRRAPRRRSPTCSRSRRRSSRSFPEGTGLDAFPGKTGAKSAIWKEWDKFKQIPVALQGYEAKLAAAIKIGDKATVGAALADTGKNGCDACHSDYREKIS